jgi:acyl-[acyl carrier protein]--UDP-N-acetylglucosamine O-acyltransferase
MVGMGSVITKHKKIEPGHVVAGNPVKFIKINQIGLSRNNISDDQLHDLQKRYNTIYETI